MSLPNERLRNIVSELASRPGHEKVRALVHELLVDGLGATSAEIRFEEPVPEVRGRLDALLGNTVFEFKKDLRQECADAEQQLLRYLPDRERATNRRFIGIATDGATFAPYEMRHGQLTPLTPFTPAADSPRSLLAWLDSVVSLQPFEDVR